MTLTFLKRISQLFCRCPLIWACPMIPLDEIRVTQHWQAATEMMLSFPGHHLRKDTMIRPLTGEVILGPSEVVSASSPVQSYSLSLCKMVSYEKLLWDYISVLLPVIHLPTNFKIHWCFLPETAIILVVAKRWLSNSNIPSTHRRRNRIEGHSFY